MSVHIQVFRALVKRTAQAAASGGNSGHHWVGQGGFLSAGLPLLWSQLVPNPLQGHFSHEEGDGKITLVPVSVEKPDEHM